MVEVLLACIYNARCQSTNTKLCYKGRCQGSVCRNVSKCAVKSKRPENQSQDSPNPGKHTETMGQNLELGGSEQDVTPWAAIVLGELKDKTSQVFEDSGQGR